MNWVPRIDYIEIYTGNVKSITFDSQPEGDPYNEETKGVYKELVSSNGNFQRQFNYNTQGYDLAFKFQSGTVTRQMDDFINNHANRGGVFKYYSSNDSGDYQLFRLESASFKKERPILDSTGLDFEYNFKFSIVRTIDYAISYEGSDVGAGALGEQSTDLVNNQTSPADVTNLVFDATATMCAVITYIIYRNTTGAGATELAESGQILAVYKLVADTWEMTRTSNGDASVGLTITNAGQVQYTTSNITGTPDQSYIRFRASTIGVD